MKAKTRIEKKRFAFIIGLFFAWMVIILINLVKLQIINYSKYAERVKKQSTRVFNTTPKRGTIYDVNGDILAISVNSFSLYIKNINKKESFQILRKIFKHIYLNKSQRKRILKRISLNVPFVWIKRKLDDREYLRLKAVSKKVNKNYKSFLGFYNEYKRLYPQNKIASHILGGVGIDEQGLGGVEYGLDRFIKGKPGNVKYEVDGRRRAFKFEVIKKPERGKDVKLTVDSGIQFFVEKALKDTVKRFKAKSGAVIVMNSNTGEILSLASYPDYYPQRINESPPSFRINNAVSFLYEPGSTFKVIVASAALDSNICYPQQKFYCNNGVYNIRDKKVYDHRAYSMLTFEDIIVYSSNIGAAKIGQKLGKVRLYNYIERFGFGKKIELGLSGEAKGLLKPLNRWSEVSPAFLSFGYEISVTPLQLTRAINVIASGGYLVNPYIVKTIGEKKLNPGKSKKIISLSTVRRIREIMKAVVNRGTGSKAYIEGISVAGKTGTAKKVKHGRYVKKYVSSFVGFFPAENPRVILYVMINEPQGLYYGGDVAAPLFKDIASKLMIYLHIFPELDSKRGIRL